MRVLITGNCGYVGSTLVRHLRQVMPAAEIIGYDTGWFAHCLTDARVLPETLLTRQHYGDVRDFPPALLEGVDAVVHLAAVSNDPMGNRFEQVTDEINAQASVRLARLAREAGVRAFVFASSCSIYGFAEGGPRRESDAVNPLTAYARSKVATERALTGMNADGMAVTCLRFATACGMSDRLRLDLVLNDFVAGALATGEITVLSDGTPWRPLIDVSDMARAIEWAIGRDPHLGRRGAVGQCRLRRLELSGQGPGGSGGGGGAGNPGVDQSRGAARPAVLPRRFFAVPRGWPRSISRSARSPTASAACGTVWPTCGLPMPISATPR